MISYEKVQRVLKNPPTVDMVELYNDMDRNISTHPMCVNEEEPLQYLKEAGKFCISATSIQSKYIAFVLGKNVISTFPDDVIQLFFNIESDYKMQFGKIKGEKIDGCICVIHQESTDFDLQKIYDNIYSL